MNSSISRRSFLAGAAITGTVLAAGLAGCEPKVAGGTEDIPVAEADTWRTPPAPISNEGIETKEVDILIIGGGLSGLTAALGAQENGDGSVLVLEKLDKSRVGGNVHAGLDSPQIQAAGLKFDAESVDHMIKDEVQLTVMDASEKYYRIWAEKSKVVLPKIISLTKEYGDESMLVQENWPTYDQKTEEYFSEVIYPCAHFVGIGTFDDNTSVILALTDSLTKNGGEIRYSTPVEQLVVENGAVIGAYASTIDGYLKILAKKGVIVCTGGFGFDEEMMAEYCHWALGLQTRFAPPEANTGDGIKMAVWAGALMQEPPVCGHIHCSSVDHYSPLPPPLPFLLVNKHGKRFTNERVSSFIIPNILVKQPERRGWQIFDSTYPEAVNELKVSTWMGTITVDDSVKKEVEDNAIVADTIEELATGIGAPPEVLKATVDRRNKLAIDGHDDDFGVPQKGFALTTITQPPFYALELGYSFMATLGGVICDPDTMQVLDEEQNPISGLYAAGNAVGGRFGAYYGNNISGLSNGFADVQGYLAGETVAKN